MAVAATTRGLVPARHGGCGHPRSVVVRGGAPRTAAPPPLAVAPTDRPLPVTPAGPSLLTAACFLLAVIALIPARKPDVLVVAPDDAVTTAHVTR